MGTKSGRDTGQDEGHTRAEQGAWCDVGQGQGTMGNGQGDMGWTSQGDIMGRHGGTGVGVAEEERGR